MPSPDRLLTFSLAALLLIVVPGRAVLFAISRALAYGRRVAFTSVAGVTSGTFTAAVLVAAGVGAIVQAFAAKVAPIAGHRTFLQGYVVGVTNPKSVVFFAAILPQFVDPAAGHVGMQMVVLGAVFALIALASDTVWGWRPGRPARGSAARRGAST